jgi:hypothetical protein
LFFGSEVGAATALDERQIVSAKLSQDAALAVAARVVKPIRDNGEGKQIASHARPPVSSHAKVAAERLHSAAFQAQFCCQ